MRTLGSYPPLNEQEASAAAEALFQAARPLFAGAAPEVVGLALAQLTALWLAGYQAPGAPREIIESLRARTMELQKAAVLGLTPVMEAEYVTGP